MAFDVQKFEFTHQYVQQKYFDFQAAITWVYTNTKPEFADIFVRML
jgi:hypothetical protein